MDRTLPPTLCKSDASDAVREFMGRIGDKWSVLLLVILARTPQQRARFSDLHRALDGISQRMLTTTLRHLERDGFVSREVFAEVPPRVEYELTPLGKSLIEPMQHLVQWVGANWSTVKDARASFDQR